MEFRATRIPIEMVVILMPLWVFGFVPDSNQLPEEEELNTLRNNKLKRSSHFNQQFLCIFLCPNKMVSFELINWFLSAAIWTTLSY